MTALSGLSRSQVETILKHVHARNHLSVLFNICAATIIHTSDLIQTKCPELKDSIDVLKRESTRARCTEAGNSNLLNLTKRMVTKLTVEVGRLLRSRTQRFFSHSQNGKNIVTTVLLIYLLPTVRFHVLSRTGHMKLVDSFWMRQTDVLQTSGHIKYKELYLYYGFFRTNIPIVSFADLFTSKPGTMVARINLFTDGTGSQYEYRGCKYMYFD